MGKILTELNYEFRIVVLKLKKYLLMVEEECNVFDKTKPDFQSQIIFIERIMHGVFTELNLSFKKLSRISSNFDEIQRRTHEEFIQEHLLHLISRYDAPLNMQICEKPFGYAGDFVAVNYFYEDNFPGYSTYGKLIDRYTLSLPLARAHINRRKYFRNVIRKLINRRGKSSITRIASFACGPAVEIFDFIEENNDLYNVQFTLVDGEAELIKLLKLYSHTLRHKIRDGGFQIIHQNILSLLRNKDLMKDFPKQNFIYCAGFIDYLKDHTVEKLIGFLFNLLEKDGILILVNVVKDPDHTAYLEMIGEWFLHHRDKEGLLALANNIEGIRQKKILADFETKKNLYLVLRK